MIFPSKKKVNTKRKWNIQNPDISSVIRSVAHDEELPVPVSYQAAIARMQTHTDENLPSSASDSDPLFTVHQHRHIQNHTKLHSMNSVI